MKSRIWEMNESKYAKIITKMQVGAIFHIQDIQRNVLPKFTELCVEMPCCPQSERNQYGSKKPTETSVTEFCYESMNSFFEEGIRINFN